MTVCIDPSPALARRTLWQALGAPIPARCVLAGGTDAMVEVNMGIAAPGTVVAVEPRRRAAVVDATTRVDGDRAHRRRRSPTPS